MDILKKLIDSASSRDKHGNIVPPGFKPPTKTLPDDFEVVVREGIMNEGDRLPSIWVEPSLSSLGDDITDWDRLIWHAAHVKALTGLKIHISEGYHSINGIRQREEEFCLSWAGSGLSSRNFEDCWTLINGMQFGYEAAMDGYGDINKKKKPERVLPTKAFDLNSTHVGLYLETENGTYGKIREVKVIETSDNKDNWSVSEVDVELDNGEYGASALTTFVRNINIELTQDEH